MAAGNAIVGGLAAVLAGAGGFCGAGAAGLGGGAVSAGPVHVSAVVAEIFGRGDLPARLADRATGAGLLWREDLHAYQVDGAPGWVVWASFVRGNPQRFQAVGQAAGVLRAA